MRYAIDGEPRRLEARGFARSAATVAATVCWWTQGYTVEAQKVGTSLSSCPSGKVEGIPALIILSPCSNFPGFTAERGRSRYTRTLSRVRVKPSRQQPHVLSSYNWLRTKASPLHYSSRLHHESPHNRNERSGKTNPALRPRRSTGCARSETTA